MAGLISMAAGGETPTSEGVKPQGAPPPEQMEDGEQPNVSPEEQEAYELFIANGMKVLYQGDPESGEKGVSPDIINRLKESSDPLENLANTAVWLTTMLETSAESNGTQLDDAVVFHGGKAMLEELVEIAEAAAIHDYSEKEIEGAWYRALDLYQETASKDGRFDPETAAQEFVEINEADRQGRLGDVLPQMGSQAEGQVPPTPANAAEEV